MSIINSHVTIEKGIRKAVPVSREELEQKIIDKCRAVTDWYDDDEEIDLEEAICEVIDSDAVGVTVTNTESSLGQNIVNNNVDLGDVIDKIIENNGTRYVDLADAVKQTTGVDVTTPTVSDSFKIDRTVDFSTENINLNEPFIDKLKPNHLIGFHTLENGLSFIGAETGGDWEEPLFLILYFDGNDIRMYIPFHGNCFNSDFMTAFSSEDSEDSALRQHISKAEFFKRIEDRYKKLGLWKTFVPDESKFTWSEEKAIELFNMEYPNHDLDWAAIKEELMTAIEVVPVND